jgi:hypothetical protein
MHGRNGSFKLEYVRYECLVLQKMHSGIAWLTVATYYLEEVYFYKI